MDSSTDFTAGYKNFFIEREMGYRGCRGIRIIYDPGFNNKDKGKFFFFPQREWHHSKYVLIQLTSDKKLLFNPEYSNYTYKAFIRNNNLYRCFEDTVLKNNEKIMIVYKKEILYYHNNLLKAVLKHPGSHDWTFYENGKKILNIIFNYNSSCDCVTLNKVFVHDLDVTEITSNYYIYKNKKYRTKLLCKKYNYDKNTRTHTLPILGRYSNY